MSDVDLSLTSSYFPFTFTVTAGTAKATPATSPLGVPQCVILGLSLLIPDGHEGQTGFQLQYNGQVVLPFGGSDQWVRGNADYIEFPITLPAGNGVVLAGFNTGVFDHSFYGRLRADYNAYGQSAQSGGIFAPAPL